MEYLLLWGIGLIAFGFVLIGVELFVPSGGAIAAIAAVSMIGGCVACWMESVTWGIISTVALIVLVPLSVNFALKLLPHTPVGKGLILGGDEDAEQEAAVAKARAEHELAEARAALVGAEGTAATDLRPVGTALIDGTRIEVLAEGGLIDKGERLRVTAVEGNEVKVRRIG